MNYKILTDDSTAISNERAMETLHMLKELGAKGLDVYNDSIILSPEFKKLLNSADYRNAIYPENYTWEQTISYIKSEELKKAFWFLINLYPQSEKNKKLVIQSVLAYTDVFKMDEVLINTFYTYAFTDPEACKIVDDIPEITRPDIFEAKLQTVNELVQYINHYRASKETAQ